MFGVVFIPLILCVSVRVLAEKWWVATILLFSPRWLIAVPLLLLIPLAVMNNRRLAIPLVGAALIVVFPFMGFNLPLSFPQTVPPGKAQLLRVLTLNLDTGKFDAAQFIELLKNSAIDVVALQEYPDSLALPLPSGWQIISERGLAVASRFPVDSGKVVQVTPPRSIWPGTYLLQTVIHAPGGDIAFCSLQFPTPRFGLQRILDRNTLFSLARKDVLEQDTAYRWRVAHEVQRYVATLSLPVVIAGDFNTPVDSPLFRQIWVGYTNAFSAVGWGFGWTQRVTIHGLPFSARIDHILTGKELSPKLCVVGPDCGSDHLPLIADIARDAR